MATIVTRSSKGSALTHTEMDANFNNLNAGLGGDVVDDTTPQLGGNLDLNGNNITGSGAIPSANLSGALPAIDGSALTNLPAGGKVLQVVQAIKTNSFSSSSTTPVNITGLSASITPSSTSSKILVSCTISYGGISNAYTSMRLAANGTGIALGSGATGSARNETTALGLFQSNAAPYHIYPASFEYLHSPNTTSAVVYTVQASSDGQPFTINYPYIDTANNYTIHGASTITVMEIGA